MQESAREQQSRYIFALRMAASEVLLEEELPVILDDTFVSYDEERLESVMEWLAKSGKQVLLFTCQKREMKILSEMGVKIVII